MNIGNRIKKIRKELDLTQTEFGSQIGTVQNTITGYENGRRNPSAPVITLICEKFNINEEWLRTGEGEMFKSTPSDILEQLAIEYNLSNASSIAVEKFVNLKPEKRNELIEFFLDVSKAILDSDVEANAATSSDRGTNDFSEDSLIQAFAKAPKTPSDLEKLFPPVEPPKRNTETG